MGGQQGRPPGEAAEMDSTSLPSAGSEAWAGRPWAAGGDRWGELWLLVPQGAGQPSALGRCVVHGF